MSFIIEHECPQCGAPIDLEETSRLFRCPYCDVENFLFARDYFRFVLLHNTPDKEMYYVPYMRFKGAVYSCMNAAIGQRIVDITHLGLEFKGLPISLGLRPQAMKLKFVQPDLPGRFLKRTLKIDDILTKVGQNTSALNPGKLFHRAYIGELLSIIYLPIYIQNNRIFDGITNQGIATLGEGEDTLSSGQYNESPSQITFMATICPQCSWNLSGEKDSVALHCSNCDSVWEASESSFNKVNHGTVPGINENSVYLPFWKIGAKSTGLKINSYADFIRVTNQPKVIQENWENEDMYFWIPAFKIRPTLFLNLSRQITIGQKDLRMVEEIPKKNHFPITLPQSEALQSMKVVLANSVMMKNKVFSLLPQLNFSIKESTLAYLPFYETGHELVQEHINISINKRVLEFGRQL